ncbi:MAG: RtcB family protein [Lachnospiraceae bacterium]|nr:RtcB family protein [Lachnospiraceae bacterium]
MIELRGKYNTCKVFTDNINNVTISQLTTLLNQDSVKGNQIRIMPDTHAGKGCVIGTTMTLTNGKVIPNLVGVDIGCFTSETKVWVADDMKYHTIKELVDLNREITVNSYNADKRYFVKNKAIARKTRENADLVEVGYYFEGCYDEQTPYGEKDKIKVRCTPDHKFLVMGNPEVYLVSTKAEPRWVEAKDLKVGMTLVSDTHCPGAGIKVGYVKQLEEKEDVYCLAVENDSNFTIKGGVVVHNCGMLAIKLKEHRVDLPKLDSVIRKYIPSGGDVNTQPKVFSTSIDTENLRCYGKPGAKIRPMLAYQSVGTLGGGNHFIEVDEDKNGDLWLVIHTGSRHLGLEVCDYYQNMGYEKIKEKFNEGTKKDKQNVLVNELKAQGRYKEIGAEIKKFKENYKEQKPNIPFELAYVDGELFDDYIYDMKMVQEHASCNRAEIARIILREMKLHEVDRFETVHNYIDTDNMILRKGAVSAQLSERLLIPINMRDGSLICVGKGNPDWNYSAPHGAGRLMSRSEAKEQISMKDFKESMNGIYTTSVSRSTIDESPMAYKPMEEIIENIKDTVEIIDIIKPIYNFKAGDE